MDQRWFTISNVSVGLSMPLFNGFVTRSKITQTKIELERTRNEIEGLKRTIDSEVASAKNNFQSAISRMDFQKQNLELAANVYQQIKKKYELGLGSQTEINLAQNEWKAAQRSMLTSSICSNTSFPHPVSVSLNSSCVRFSRIAISFPVSKFTKTAQ